MTMEIRKEVQDYAELLKSRSNADFADQMERYMKNQFSFLGVKSPVRKEAQKQMIRSSKTWTAEDLIKAANLLYTLDEREYHYSACDLLRKRSKKLRAEHLGDLKDLVLTRSWWDTVDALAGTIGDFLLLHPQLQPATTDSWMASDELWLRRVALIHQLKYKENTDWPMLRRYVNAVKDSEEFFMQKGAGWALRQYSKFEPEVVREYLAATDVMPLTQREASKYI